MGIIEKKKTYFRLILKRNSRLKIGNWSTMLKFFGFFSPSKHSYVVGQSMWQNKSHFDSTFFISILLNAY